MSKTAAMAEKRIGQGLRPSTYVDQTTSPEGTLWE